MIFLFFMTIFFFSLNTPMILSIFLLFMALSMSITISMVWKSWFALLLFLVYIGGMMIMFSYFCILFPNYKTYFEPSSMILLTFFLLSLTHNPFHFSIIPFSFFSSFSTSSEIFSILSFSQKEMYMFLAVFLLILLIILVKIAKTKNSPMRPMIYA